MCWGAGITGMMVPVKSAANSKRTVEGGDQKSLITTYLYLKNLDKLNWCKKESLFHFISY